MKLLSFVYRAEGGELQSVLDRDEIPEEAVVVRFLRQVLKGLAFLHQHDIAHLDLKVITTKQFRNKRKKMSNKTKIIAKQSQHFRKESRKNGWNCKESSKMIWI